MKCAILLCLLAPLLASAQTPLTVQLNWVAPSAYTNGTAITGAVTYDIYQTPQGATSGGTQLWSGLTGPNFTLSAGIAGAAFVAGQTYCWNVTAVVGHVESAYSNQACKTFAAPPPPVLVPAAPTGLTAQ